MQREADRQKKEKTVYRVYRAKDRDRQKGK